MDWRYRQLRWVVEVSRPPPWGFEPIAAFDNDTIAIRYAGKCKEANPEWAYRVMERPETEPEPDWKEI